MWRQHLVERLEREPGLVAAYLFGSRARGTAGEASDIDVGILLESTPRSFADTPLELAGELETLLGKRVDIAIMNAAPPDLLHRILRDGQVLIDRDRSRRIRFEVHARNQYFDTQRLRDAYRRAARARS
jgi:uncharacterized protein